MQVEFIPSRENPTQKNHKQGEGLPHKLIGLLGDVASLTKSEAKLTKLAGQDYINSILKSSILKLAGVMLGLIGCFYLCDAAVECLTEVLHVQHYLSSLIVGLLVVGLGVSLCTYLSTYKADA